MGMARLIDAKALEKQIKEIFEESNPYVMGIMLRWIRKQNTVDAVPVVRCKDCQNGIWDEEEQMWECVLAVDLTGDLDTYSMFHEYNDGEHFCSYGERKDGGLNGNL